MPRDPKKIPSLIIYDWETSGLDKKDNMHCKRVAVTEFAAVVLNGSTLEEILKYENVIAPYDSSLIYQQEAANLTGLTKERCQREGITLKQLAADLEILFEEANIHKSKIYKPLLIAHNSSFDTQFLQEIADRTKLDLSKYIQGYKDPRGFFVPKHIDSIDLAKMMWREQCDTDTKFNLEACITKAGLEISDSHRALQDCIALADFVRYVLTRMSSGSSEVTIVEGKATAHRATFQW